MIATTPAGAGQEARIQRKHGVVTLLPYLWPKGQLEMRVRVLGALAALACAKAATVYVPLLYRDSIDALTRQGVDDIIAQGRKGYEVETKAGKKASFRIAYEQDVQDVGNRAAWAAKQNQLSFAAGTLILHLTVEVGNKEENLAKAKDIAVEVADSV